MQEKKSTYARPSKTCHKYINHKQNIPSTNYATTFQNSCELRFHGNSGLENLLHFSL